ncbi:hypothetical protein ACTM4P_08200 [Citrobacter freundii]|uniref:hypothetical protein n=1 Tax=Citrobacter freundii TaxID=546 RepID=UPI0028BD2560|nr:hypothetical protein [Citrobacter freundii]MDT7054335.1 hypothetical protein [Citrobacter freundii]
MAATKSEQFEYNENPASAGFLLSGDTTGVFANVLRHSTPVISSIHNRPQENKASQLSGAFWRINYERRVKTQLIAKWNSSLAGVTNQSYLYVTLFI